MNVRRGFKLVAGALALALVGAVSLVLNERYGGGEHNAGDGDCDENVELAREHRHEPSTKNDFLYARLNDEARQQNCDVH